MRSVVDELSHAVFGIELFLIRDRDGLSDEIITLFEGNLRFRALPRRHVENYLLDADVLSNVAEAFYLPSDRRDAARIRETLREIASSSVMQAVLWNVRESIRGLSSLPAPSVRSVDDMSRDELAEAISDHVKGGLVEVSRNLDPSTIRKLVIKEHAKLSAALLSDDWLKLLPGKLLFGRLCGEFLNVEKERVREAYADIAMRTKPDVFDEIAQIFKVFSGIAASSDH